MRFPRLATTAFITASPSSRVPFHSLAPIAVAATSLSPSRNHRHSHLLSRPSSILFFSTLFTAQPYHPNSSTVAAAAASSEQQKEESEAAASPGNCDANLSSKSTKTESATTTIEEDMNSSFLPDPKYPGTAVQRLHAVHQRVAILANDGSLNESWENVRRRLLWAGGLRDLPHATPGMGYTGHSFNDYNHVDLTTMNDESSDNLNDGSVKGIAVGNRLGPGIRIASLPELGPGGSWSTCAIGCHTDPPRDVAHIQFRSRVAFKLVWVPNANYDTFVLVDDDGKLLAVGTPSDGPGALPPRRERERNYQIMKGSKYATVAESLAAASLLDANNETQSKTQ
ncbi:hypothetical protein ACHAWU_003525 [Discostella pseudostelligera]|uniref:Uncharacterized protein n=1 Tax=Discostella pseudostelligera TaxID=259834 RepID=A0ABD3LYG4_9STRA